MTPKEVFAQNGFSVIDAENGENRLRAFLTENYPQTIRGGEINIAELKAAAGMQIDEKTNGYGLNFVGRNVARAKYAQKTAKELKINRDMSKNFENTQNTVLKGDNIDCLKILKSHYGGKIKCIYIDPPYNTDSDEFVYPDKFDMEEAEVLGLAGLSETDMERLEFSFRSKKSHNGWLSFMYPRLALARELLSKDGVIFISIDDNEQANLRVVCDEIFGDENFAGQIVWQTATDNNPTQIATEHEYVICYVKNLDEQYSWEISSEKGKFIQEKYNELKAIHNDDLETIQSELRRWIRKQTNGDDLSGVAHYSYIDERGVFYPGNSANTKPGGYTYDIIHPITKQVCAKPEYGYRFTFDTFADADKRGDVLWGDDERIIPKIKKRLDTVAQRLKSYYYEDNRATTAELKALFDGVKVFNNPKSVNFLKLILKFVTSGKDSILDFFAGSGTTAHAVMQLNAEDNDSHRRFILCQIDEPIKEDKPAYRFCVDNSLPPLISSITIERLRRAGEKIKGQRGLLHSADNLDIGFKVFDLIDAPRLDLDGDRIVFPDNGVLGDPLSRVYNMIFSVGTDDPTAAPECVLENSMYRIGNNYYITNAAELDKDENRHLLPEALKGDGKVFIDGWTATINTTLQTYKEDVKIVV
jgi:adenine-specific DNA-methyltransferase